MRDNKWKGRDFDELYLVFPKPLADMPGISAIKMEVTDILSEEVIIILQDPTDFIYEIAKINPFVLMVRPGLFRTDYGNILCVLWWIPDPRNVEIPFVIFETTLDIRDPQHMNVYYELSEQNYWHLFLITHSGKVLDMYEFENKFKLKEKLLQRLV